MTRRLALCLGLLSLPAFPDVIPDSESACRGLAPGSGCRAEFGPGACTPTTCRKKDYSQGIPPRTKTVDCLRCLPEEASDGGARGADAGAPPDGGPSRLKKKKRSGP